MHDTGAVVLVEGWLPLATRVGDHSDPDDGLDARSVGPEHLQPQLVEAGFSVLADAAELTRTRNVPCDDAEGPRPEPADRGLVPGCFPGEDDVQDHRASLLGGRVDMCDPGRDVLGLGPRVGTRGIVVVLSGVVQTGPT